ncbi:VWA domain-containing protein [Acidianus sulfidivorans JP7]|uniref:VWA domain-containing protein n=1 Tax=Acidianus sulfidivorans JP7 TaxID=619593 RepID=A0A2U9IN79_9CREN|nr:VWA domain-containing protein [Acidianus sulfidivorans]AWR97404.1 VWA domain-containing protein [Acidianus sulfidivorans JP7]
MTISLKIKSSHNYISDAKNTEVGLSIYIVPENASTTSNIRYILAIDNSPSMKGDKFNTAISSAITLLSKIPKTQQLILIVFSNHPQIIYQGYGGNNTEVENKLQNLQFGGTTRFHETVRKIIEIASDGIPTKAILLTDGKPKDKGNLKDYEKLQIPSNLSFISIGIGRDYNEIILKSLADRTAGFFYHIEDPSQLPSIIEEQQTTDVFATNFSLEVPNNFYPLNYDLPINIPVVDRLLAVYGTMIVPAGKENYQATFIAKYQDPVDNQLKSLTYNLELYRSNDENVINSNINTDVLAEIRYYKLLKEYSELLEKGKDVTRVAKELMTAAEQTRKTSLIEATQRLTGDSKTDLSEVTKKMRSS